MSSSLASLAPKTLADHEITLFYQVDGLDMAKGPDVYFRDLLSEECDDTIPRDQREALGGRYEFMPIWRKVDSGIAGKTEIAIGADLHPDIRSILAGTRPDIATRWLPTDNARRLLASADLYPLDADKAGIERVKKAVIWEPTPATEKRFAVLGLSPRKLRLTVESLDLVLFSTRKGFAQASVTLSPLDNGGPLCALELLEAIHALSRFNRFRWYALESEKEAGSQFTLGSLIRRLCLGRTKENRPSGRVFTYALARFKEAVPAAAADLFAIYAARHYTTDYALAQNSEGYRRVREFETIGHSIAVEGAATVIAPASEGQLPEFLGNFKTHTFHANYLPVTLLALHEHGFLVDKTSIALLTPQQRTVPDEMRHAFLQLARDALEFRVLFRNTEVSLITMHNALNRALREMLGLDRMMVEFSSDIAEISSFLQRQDLLNRGEEDHKRNRRFWFFSVIGTGVLAALTASALVKDGIKALTATKHGILALEGDELAAFIAFVVGAVILVCACLVGVLNRPPQHAPSAGSSHDGHGFADHAASDVVLHKHQDVGH